MGFLIFLGLVFIVCGILFSNKENNNKKQITEDKSNFIKDEEQNNKNKDEEQNNKNKDEEQNNKNEDRMFITDLVASGFEDFYYSYLAKILNEINRKDYSHISSLDEDDDKLPDLSWIVNLKRDGKFVEANGYYMEIVKKSYKVDSSVLYSWYKTLMAAGAIEEACAILVLSIKILIALRYQMIKNSPFQQTIQLFKLIKIIERKNLKELLEYMNMLAGLHSADNSDNDIYNFQKKVIDILNFNSINLNKYLNLEKELGRDFLKKQEMLMENFGLNL